MFEVKAEALPKDGSYTVFAQIHGLTKNRQVVEGRTEEVGFTRETSPRGQETAAKVVVREGERPNRPAQFPLTAVLAITAVNLVIGVAAYLVLWRKPTVRSAPAPKYIPQKSLLDAIGDLENRVTQKDVSLEDPIFERQADAEEEQPAEPAAAPPDAAGAEAAAASPAAEASEGEDATA